MIKVVLDFLAAEITQSNKNLAKSAHEDSLCPKKMYSVGDVNGMDGCD